MADKSPDFSVPKDGESYINLILERCYDLIDTGVWQGIEKTRLDRWLGNFRDLPERYFAAVVLDALIYRSREQTLSLMTQLFQRVLPDLVRTASPSLETPADWLAALSQTGNDPGVRIVPVIRDDDPPTKSGPLVARFLKRHLRLREQWMIWPWQIPDAIGHGVRLFLFVDDFLGTGWQFKSFVVRMNVDLAFTNTAFIYVPLVAHSRGLRVLSQELPSILCSAVEILQKEHGLFAKGSEFFNDGANTPQTARRFYGELLVRHNLTHLRRAFGYGRLGLAYAFDHAAPNASLPLLWVGTDDWFPLFDR